MLLVTLAVTLLSWWRTPAPPVEGLVARYYATSDWSGPTILERIDRDLGPELLASTPALRTLAQFSVEWTGFLVVRRDGIYSYVVTSDDGAWLWLDDQLLIDNGGSHGVQSVRADIRLTRGIHRFKARYNQTGGDYFLALGALGHRGRINQPGALIPHEMTYSAFRAHQLWPLAVVGLWYVALGVIIIRLSRVVGAFLGSAEAWRVPSDRGTRVIVMLAALACGAHIAYGLPAVPSFSVDELEPLDVLLASGSAFRDWNLRWPPFHLFVIAGALRPFHWAETIYGLVLTDTFLIGLLYIVSRAISVLMVAGVVFLTIDATRILSGRTAGYFAGALLACSPLVVYFGALGNLEVPHLFWVTASFWAFVKLWHDPGDRLFILFGAAVGLSLATKDQSYGYYVAAPVALVWRLRREKAAPELRAWLDALADRRLFYLVVASLGAFMVGHALPWEHERFMNRFAVMTAAPQPYQMFPATAAGYSALLSTTAKCFIWAAGVPLTVAALAGAVEYARQRRVGELLCLLMPAVTYFVTFLGVILYVYDRFLIGWLPLAAAAGGLLLARLVRKPRVHYSVLLAIGILTAGAANVIAMNAVFFRDPRHAAWRWINDNIACGSSIGVSFDRFYIPELDCYDVWPIAPATLREVEESPRYLVFNEAYVQRFTSTADGRTFLEQLHAGHLGYRLVFRADAKAPLWAPMYWETRFWNRKEDPETTADKPLHAIEVWECSVGTPCSEGARESR